MNDQKIRARNEGWRRRCSAQSKTSREQCGKWAMAGQQVCRAHGGAAHKARGLTVFAEDRGRLRASALVARFDGAMYRDPLHCLLDMVQRAATAERAYAALIGELDQILIDSGDGRNRGARCEPHVYIRLWGEERDRLARVARMAIDANVSARQAMLDSSQAEVLVGVIEATLAAPEVGLAEGQALALKRQLGREIRKAIDNTDEGAESA